MKIHIILLVLISTFSGEATGIKPCLGKESYLKDTKGSLEQLIFESLRILNCSPEFDPVFRAALEVERNLNSFTDKHLTALLRVADSQIEGQVRQETKEMILAMAAARPGMMSLYDPRKAQQRLEDIYKGIPGENLRALALLLRARVVRDRYPESAEGIMNQFFTEFDKKIGRAHD